MKNWNIATLLLASALFFLQPALESQARSQKKNIEEILLVQTGLKKDIEELKFQLSIISERQKDNIREIETAIKNQADIKESLESISMRINELTANKEEDRYYSQELVKSLNALSGSKFLSKLNSLDERLAELHSTVTEASMEQNHKSRLIQEEFETTFIALFNQMDEIIKKIAEKKGTAGLENGAENQADADGAESGKKKLKVIPANISPEDLYRNAYKNFLQGDYEQSVFAFSEYVTRHPDTDLTDNSQYWLGESLAKLEKLEESIAAFKSVEENYPESTKAPISLWRASELLEKLGDKEKLKEVLEKIRDSYPASSQATQAQDKLNSLK